MLPDFLMGRISNPMYSADVKQSRSLLSQQAQNKIGSENGEDA